MQPDVLFWVPVQPKYTSTVEVFILWFLVQPDISRQKCINPVVSSLAKGTVETELNFCFGYLSNTLVLLWCSVTSTNIQGVQSRKMYILLQCLVLPDLNLSNDILPFLQYLPDLQFPDPVRPGIVC